METQTEIHNRVAGEVVRAIVKSPLAAGGGFSDVLVILESVILGVMLMGEKLGECDMEELLCEIVLHVTKRLAVARRQARSVN